MIHRLVDRIAARYADGDFRPEAARARREYMERGGKVFDDDGDLFESRMASFLEWYVLERPLGEGATPVARALGDGSLSEDERREAACLATSHRSLFDLRRVDGGVLDLDDLVGGARFAVVERRGTAGFAAGDVFEARLIWDGQSVVFGKTFLFHPRDAREEVLGAIEAAARRGLTREEIAFALSRLYVRWHRLGHVAAAKVYRGDASDS